MSTLIVLGFENEDSAKAMQAEIAQLQKQELIELDDAAIIVRNQKGKAKVKQAVDLVGTGALGGAFWGMLVGMIFLVPIFGLAVGAATGALSGKLSDYGIDDDFIKSFKDKVQPGQSALFLLVRKVTLDKVLEELTQSNLNPKILHTSLSREKEAELQSEWERLATENEASVLDTEG